MHVWGIDVQRWRPRMPMLRALLAPDERARADRFRFRADAERLIIGRGVLRLILGELLHASPDQVAVSRSASGKPAVDGIEFNVAHASDVILIATHEHRVGIDVERVDARVDLEAIACACFTARERDALAGSSSREEAFFRLWTRKEAWVKAVGTGLTLPLRQVDVADAAAPVIGPGAAVVAGARPWRILDLPASPGYAAACALSGPECGVHLWQLDEPFGAA